jgi:hypothetical protein
LAIFEDFHPFESIVAMAQTLAPASMPSAENTAKLVSQECMFNQLYFPGEIRVKIWMIYFDLYNEKWLQRLRDRFQIPNLIKAMRQKETLEIYYEALQIDWETTEFMFTEDNVLNFLRPKDKKQVQSIQSLRFVDK